MSTQKSYLFILLSLLIASSLLSERGLAQNNEDPLEILMITGGGPWHDYNVQKDQIKDGLEERLSNINITIDYEGAETLTMESTDFKFSRHLNEGWAADFDVVIYNQCNLQVKDESYVKGIIAEHVKYQVPAVMLHCPVHLYQYARGDGADAWWNFTGAVSYAHEKENHPNTPPYTIEVLEPEHPIMKNYPRSWRTPKGELYLIIEMDKNAKPLSHAFSVETQSYVETAWTHEYEGVKVFTSTLGHHNESMGADVNLNLIASGILWATENLNEDGSPSEGYEGDRGLGWISLLDDEGTLNGWVESGGVMDWTSPQWYSGNVEWPTNDDKVKGESFSREDNMVVSEGEERNLFYDGRVAGGLFKNFEFKVDVYTFPESTSSIFFHTRYEENGDPVTGYRAQINAGNGNMNKTGSLESYSDVEISNHKDEEWFNYYIKVNGNQVTIKVNDEIVNDYTLSKDVDSNNVKWGTIGLHSSGSDNKVLFKNPMIRLLPD
jgi:hypothetical protein